MEIDLNIISEIIVAVLFIVFSRYIIPWIKSKTTEQQRKLLAETVEKAVQAAEQMFQGPGRGPEKRFHVVKFLSNHGIRAKLNDDELDILIESAVLNLKKQVTK